MFPSCELNGRRLGRSLKLFNCWTVGMSEEKTEGVDMDGGKDKGGKGGDNG